jgi:hypothetical protein
MKEKFLPLGRLAKRSRAGTQLLRLVGDLSRARAYRRAITWSDHLNAPDSAIQALLTKHARTPLEALFDGNLSGPGVWKWRHYFKQYDRHLARFRGRSPVVAEVGVFSGGSIGMWHRYFGEGCAVHGIDLDPRCKAYETERTRIHVGDQASRAFWREFRRQVPRLDILIDDGGHTPEQQMTTFEEMFPHIAPGGVFICEDVEAASEGGHQLSAFVAGLADRLHHLRLANDRSATNPLQRMVEAITLYPMMVVIERRAEGLPELTSERRGTEWQPPSLLDAQGRQVQGRGM